MSFGGECLPGGVIAFRWSAGALGGCHTPVDVPPSAEVVPVVEVSPVEMPPSAEVVSVAEVPPVEVPPSAEIVVPASEEATSTVEVLEDCNSAVLEDFIGKVTKNISPPLLDKPPRRPSS